MSSTRRIYVAFAVDPSVELSVEYRHRGPVVNLRRHPARCLRDNGESSRTPDRASRPETALWHARLRSRQWRESTTMATRAFCSWPNQPLQFPNWPPVSTAVAPESNKETQSRLRHRELRKRSPVIATAPSRTMPSRQSGPVACYRRRSSARQRGSGNPGLSMGAGSCRAKMRGVTVGDGSSGCCRLAS